jgi:hypothetical protein
MKWSVNDVCGSTFLTVGMWHAMQPVAGFTGHGFWRDVSERLASRGGGGDPSGRALPAWHERHFDS